MATWSAGWWRRNRWGFAAFVVVLPLSVWTVFATGWFTYFESRPTQPVAVTGDTPRYFGGHAFALTDAHALDSDTVPAGSGLITAVIEVEPGPADADGLTALCELTLARADGAGEWRALSLGEFGWRPADRDAASGCEADRTSPYLIETAFLVPDDAVDRELVVRLVLASELPRYLSFTLERR